VGDYSACNAGDACKLHGDAEAAAAVVARVAVPVKSLLE
jgi:hypothetical protein